MSDPRVPIRRKLEMLARRKKHVSKTVRGTPERPRLVIYRSNKHVYAQIVDDLNQLTITGCSTLTPALKEKVAAVKGKLEEGKMVGKHIAELAKGKGIEKVCFDRNGCRYHGRVKALADGAREGGLQL